MLLAAGPLADRVPYLAAGPGDWAARVAALPGHRIGLVWAGNPALGRRAADAVDARRSIPFALLAPLLAVPGISFVSLQKGATGEGLHDWTGELADFADTAALIMALDLVITVDTSVAHLAGALGRPVWLLNRFDTDWRWGLGRADCDWYPSLRQFRQDRPGDWQTVVAQLVDALTSADPAALDAAGQTAWHGGDRLAAARCFRRAVALRPDLADTQSNLGLALQAEGNLPGAEAAFRAAIATQPAHVPALINLGRLLRGRGLAAEAETCIRAALAADPGQPVALGNLANLLAGDGRAAEAVPLYERAIAAAPGEVEPLVNLGITLTGMQQPAAAISTLRQAIARRPDHVGAHLAQAEALLLDGQYREGFREYAWRHRLPATQPRALGIPAWDGRPAPGKTLLIQSEQGLGDVIMLARFATLAAQRLRVVLHAPSALLRVLAGLEGVAQIAPREAPPPPADLRCDLFDLPSLLGIRLGTLPAPRAYLRAEAGRFAGWLAQLPGRKVGLAWAGNPGLRALSGADLDTRRSIKLARLAPLAGRASFVSLQTGAAGREVPPEGLALHDRTAELADFADTASLIAGLDLVISVDTAVAHLAAALGRPVWLLNRFDTDWRWGIGRSDSPWYPSLRQFRQPAWGDWESVVAAVAIALEAR
jgi:tetratricopeptide (TPR) repeat protein